MAQRPIPLPLEKLIKSRYQAAAKYQRYLDHGFELRSIDELEDEGRPKGIVASVEVINWSDLRR